MQVKREHACTTKHVSGMWLLATCSRLVCMQRVCLDISGCWFRSCLQNTSTDRLRLAARRTRAEQTQRPHVALQFFVCCTAAFRNVAEKSRFVATIALPAQESGRKGPNAALQFFIVSMPVSSGSSRHIADTQQPAAGSQQPAASSKQQAASSD